MKKERVRTVRNEQGIRIVAICASCKHCPIGKVIDHDCEFRMCVFDPKNKKAVKPSDTCVNWEAKEPYTLVGRTDKGQVKRKEYVEMVTSIRIEEMKNKVTKEDEMKTSDLRNMFLAEYDTLYYDM